MPDAAVLDLSLARLPGYESLLGIEAAVAVLAGASTDERRILVLNRDEARAGERDAFRPPELLDQASIMEARQQILGLRLADELEEYIVNVVVATRDPGSVDACFDSVVGKHFVGRLHSQHRQVWRR